MRLFLWPFRASARRHALQNATYVLAMEVLDNLPHDKLVRADAASPWQEAWVCTSSSPRQISLSSSDHVVNNQLGSDGTLREEMLRDLQDPLVMRCLAAADWLAAQPADAQPSSQAASFWSRALDAIAGVQGAPSHSAKRAAENTLYVPTGALQLFDALHRMRPRHHLIAADFASFAQSAGQLEGCNAPIVSTTVWCCHLRCIKLFSGVDLCA